MITWGPWITTYLPSVGMYIQMELENEDNGERKREEGIIAGWKDNISWFVGEGGPVDSAPWVVRRWRRPIDDHRGDVRIRKRELVSNDT